MDTLMSLDWMITAGFLVFLTKLPANCVAQSVVCVCVWCTREGKNKNKEKWVRGWRRLHSVSTWHEKRAKLQDKTLQNQHKTAICTHSIKPHLSLYWKKKSCCGLGHTIKEGGRWDVKGDKSTHPETKLSTSAAKKSFCWKTKSHNLILHTHSFNIC